MKSARYLTDPFYRAVTVVLVYIYCAFGYLYTNYFFAGTPQLLPLTWLDQNIPFLPQTGWIYILIYVVPISALVFVRRTQHLFRMLVAFVSSSTLCFLVFFWFPTQIVRPPLVSESWGSLPLYFVYSIDRPFNCFPSLHVVYAFLTAEFVRRERRYYGYVLYVVACLISVSTLTTKQHYSWDVLAGMLLAGVAIYLSGRQDLSHLDSSEESAVS